MRRHLAVLVGGAALVSSPASPRAEETTTPARPNVIFVLADDLGWAEIGSYGQQKIRTPSLDRLAAEGLRFTQHYSGNAVCAPSRSVLLTGQHPGHTPIRDNREVQPEGQAPLPAAAITFAELFKKLGYATGAMGKWGLGPPSSEGDPLRQGFDHFFGYNCQRQAHNYYPTYLYDDDRRLPLDNPAFSAHQKLPEGADPADPKSYAPYSGNVYAPDLIWERARAFIRENKDRPFFLYLPTTVPHLALQVPEDSLAGYRGLWPDPPYTGGNGYLPHPSPRAAYAAMVTRMDREVGRILDLVRDLGLEERTIVVFTSDNGPTYDRLGGSDSEFFRSAGPFRGLKGSLYEGGVRVPAIVRWPGRVPAGLVSERVTGFEDWLPTLLDLVGAADAIPPRIDGASFAATLQGRAQEPRAFLYREFPDYGGQQSVRVGDWKGVRQGLEKKGPPRLELYDLKGDVGETSDVAAAHPDVVAQMEAVMAREHQPSAAFPIRAIDGESPTPATAPDASRVAPTIPRLNIVSIVTDDQASWAMGAYGNPDARTPVLDRLAREGVLFRNAFVTTPVCSPSRAGFLTGRYGTELGIGDWISPDEAASGLGLPPGTPTWPAILREHGWRTALLGKWHLGRGPRSHPTAFGIERFFGFLDGGNTPMDPTLEVEGREQVLKGSLPDLLVDEAIRFVTESRDRPFALLLHFRAPHLPYGPVPEVDAAALRDVDPAVPEVRGLDREQVKGWTRDYLASVHSVDRNVGRLLQALDQLGLAGRTIVLFTGDNGYNIGRHVIHTKGNGHWIAGGVPGPPRPNMFDTSLRVPLVVRGPGLPAGREVVEAVTQLDTLPTVLSLLGVPLPAGLVQHGADFSPLVRGETVPWRDTVFGEFDMHHYTLARMRMIRTARHKLVRYLGTTFQDELYDLVEDPGETRNLYGSDAARAVRADLEGRLREWRRGLGVE
jgi:arylsulfatase A